MAVQAFGEQMQGNGLEQSMEAFNEAHEKNSRSLLNLAEGRKATASRPMYDPSHPDNLWPVMLHHPGKGELTVGRTLKGVNDTSERAAITKANLKAKAEALSDGYRLEPYVKPQVAVLDPAAEKAQLLKRNQELEGHITQLNDQFAKLVARLDAKDKE